MRGRRGLAAALAAFACAAVWLAVAEAAPASATTPGSGAAAARLQGTFAMTGRVTVARFVRGEHRGQIVQRSWSFAPGCAAGPCPAVVLTRLRAGGTDTVVLKQRRPGVYSGRGRFYRPLRCGHRIYRPGERIPFVITVTITGTIVDPTGATVASAISATYVNPRRVNLTPCVAGLGHDAARYSGQLAT